MKKLLPHVLILFFSTTSFAQGAQSPLEIEDIFSCSMMDGHFIHKIFKAGEGYNAHITFPMYFTEASAEEIEQKKKEWRNWDPNSGDPQPAPANGLGVAIPMTNNNVMTFDNGRLIAKASILQTLFPPIEYTEFVPLGFNSFYLDFDSDNCQFQELENSMSVFCETSKPTTLFSGESVERIGLYMASQKTSTVVPDPADASKSILVTKNTVEAQVIFLYKGQTIRSSFTYTPNGNDRQCLIRGYNLPELDK